jgi:hypothetical protein
LKQRWTPVGVLAGILFATNLIARLVVRLAFPHSAESQTRVGLVAISLVAVVMAGAAYRWGRRYPMPRVLGELAAAAGTAGILSVLVGPYVAGSAPFKEGADFFVGQIVQYALFAFGGAFLGLLVVMALGQDWKAQSWRRYEESVRARPRRVVRR